MKIIVKENLVMLAYFLAILVAFVSLTLYLTAFLRPQIHRQDDFLWSGLGLFYSLTLWICAGRITGAVLLGQLAIVIVVIAFIWENSQLRQTITSGTNSNQALEGFSILSLISSLLSKLPPLNQEKKAKQQPVSQPTSSSSETITESEKPEQTESKTPAETSSKVSTVKPQVDTDVTDILAQLGDIVEQNKETKEPPSSESSVNPEKVVEQTETSTEKDQEEKVENKLVAETSKTEETEKKQLDKQTLPEKQGWFDKVIATITKPFRGQSSPEELKNGTSLLDLIDEDTTPSEEENIISDSKAKESGQNNDQDETKLDNTIKTNQDIQKTSQDESPATAKENVEFSSTQKQESDSTDVQDSVLDQAPSNLKSESNAQQLQKSKVDVSTENAAEKSPEQSTGKLTGNKDGEELKSDSQAIPNEDTISSLTDLTESSDSEKL